MNMIPEIRQLYPITPSIPFQIISTDIWVGTPNGLNVTDINRKMPFALWQAEWPWVLRLRTFFYLSGSARASWLGFQWFGGEKCNSPNRIQTIVGQPARTISPILSFPCSNIPMISSGWEPSWTALWNMTETDSTYISQLWIMTNWTDRSRPSPFIVLKMTTVYGLSPPSIREFTSARGREGYFHYQNLCLKNTPSLVSDCISTLFMDKDNNRGLRSRV